MVHMIDLRQVRPKKIYPLDSRFRGKRPDGQELSFTNYYLELDGKPFFAAAGEIHFSRLWEGYWEDEILKMKAGGVNIISTYVFWIHHEEEAGAFDFSGRRNLRQFVELCGKHNLSVIVRIGPFCHGEVRNGGLPDWLYGKPFEVRSLDEAFLACVRRLYGRIGQELAGLFYQDGGPIIAAQLDNEYMASASPWERSAGTSNDWLPGGQDGAAYLLRLRDMAREAGIEPPVYTCTGWGSPVPEDLLPLWGGYAFRPWLFYASPGEHPVTEEYLYRDCHCAGAALFGKNAASYSPETKPYCCCEMGGGMFCSYYYRFQLPYESVDAMANVKLASGCNMPGYYMYHGGTNPKGRRVLFLNEGQTPQLSYDFQAALGEFGQTRPSYHRLRALHLFASAFAEQLCPAKTVLPGDAETISPDDTGPLRFALRMNGNGGFIFINNYQDHVKNAPKQNETITLHLPDETITAGPFGLAAGENCVLPINLSIAGILLKYALAQPITVMNVQGETYAFFFTPEGMESVYCFEKGVRSRPDAGEVRADDTLVRCSAPGMSVFTAIKGEKQLHVVTLTRKQSQEFYLCRIGETAAAILTEGAVLVSSGGVRVEHNRNVLDYGIFPNLPAPGGAIPLAGDGLFSRYRLEKAAVELRPALTAIGQYRYVVRIPSWDSSAVKDVLLGIHYEGDVGRAFIDGDMISDNFWNGAPWELGLREFARRLAEQPLTICLSPRKKDSRVKTDSAMAERVEEVSGAIGRVDKVEAQARYEWMLA